MESVSPCLELQWFPKKKTDSELLFPGASTISMPRSITGSYIYHTSASAAPKLCGIRCITKKMGKDFIAAKDIGPVINTEIPETWSLLWNLNLQSFQQKGAF